MSILKKLVNAAHVALATAGAQASKVERFTDVTDEMIETPAPLKSTIADLVAQADDAAFETTLAVEAARAAVEQVKEVIDSASASVAGLVEFLPDSCKQMVDSMHEEVFYVFDRAELEKLLATAFIAGAAQ